MTVPPAVTICLEYYGMEECWRKSVFCVDCPAIFIYFIKWIRPIGETTIKKTLQVLYPLGGVETSIQLGKKLDTELGA